MLDPVIQNNLKDDHLSSQVGQALDGHGRHDGGGRGPARAQPARGQPAAMGKALRRGQARSAEVGKEVSLQVR